MNYDPENARRIRERQKVKTCFLPGMSAKNHWQSQRFFEGQTTKTREGFIFGRTLIRAGFCCRFIA
jgi:hypothetical protein